MYERPYETCEIATVKWERNEPGYPHPEISVERVQIDADIAMGRRGAGSKFMALDIETTHCGGIACIGIALADVEEPIRIYQQEMDGGIAKRLTAKRILDSVEFVYQYRKQGYTLVSWNGAGFDLRKMAELLEATPAAVRLLRQLASDHIDMMFHCLAVKGYPVSLRAACEGTGVKGKTEGMSGAQAIDLWEDPARRTEIIDYCAQDARATLDLFFKSLSRGQMNWISRKGRLNTLALSVGWMTVRAAMRTELPDTSWMDSPMPRSQFVDWLEDEEFLTSHVPTETMSL